jgi:hypothetical protein
VAYFVERHTARCLVGLSLLSISGMGSGKLCQPERVEINVRTFPDLNSYACRVVFLNQKFCQYNPELQMIFQSISHRVEDNGIPNCLNKEVEKYYGSVFSSSSWSLDSLLYYNQLCLHLPLCYAPHQLMVLFFLLHLWTSTVSE